MHIKMLQTRRGSPDGFTVALYDAGDVYDVGDSLGTRFVRDGWATELDAEASPKPAIDAMARANTDFDRTFRPQSTRGSAPTNVATLLAKGIEL